MKSDQKGFSLILIVVIIILLTASSTVIFRIVQSNNKADNEKTIVTSGVEPNTTVISGVIDSFNRGCQADDAFCSINLKDGTQLITECGGLGPDGKTGCDASYNHNLLRKEDQIEATVVQKSDDRYYIECKTCGVKIVSDVSYYIPNYDESSPGTPPGSVNLRGTVTGFFDERPVDGDAGVIIDDKFRIITAIARDANLSEDYWGIADDVQEGDVVAIFADYVSENRFTIGGEEGPLAPSGEYTYWMLKVQ